MSLLRQIGRKHAEIASQWLGSAGVYSAVGATALVYFTDWKAVLQYLPYYNGKYVKEE